LLPDLFLLKCVFNIPRSSGISRTTLKKREGRKTGVESNGWSSISATAVEHSLCFKKEKKKLNDSILQLPPSIPRWNQLRDAGHQHAPH